MKPFRHCIENAAGAALAQIDPEADTSRYVSILNLFAAPEATETLTDWDTAYLKGLYDAERVRSGKMGGTPMQVHQHFAFSGPVSRDTQNQVAMQSSIGIQRAMRKNG